MALARACGCAGRATNARNRATGETRLPALIGRGAAVLVACSGGADSVALAAGLVELARARPELGLRVSIGHVDHGLRAASASEAEAVRALAASLDARFFLERLEPPALQAAMRRDGLEAAARDFRYAALERLAGRAGASLVATAHTRRDQAETVLLRLARGGGLGAVAGIRAERALGSLRLVRPLLEVSRASTEAFCAARHLLHANDPHNRDPRRARARLRSAFDQLAALLNPRLELALASAARIAAEEDALLARLAQDALEVAHAADGSHRVASLAALPDALLRRALLVVARDAGARPQRQHLEALCARLREGAGALDLPGARALIHEGALRFQLHSAASSTDAAAAVPTPPAPLAIPGPGRYLWSGHELIIEDPALPGTGALFVDPTRAPFPWTVRAHSPGDRFRPSRGHLKKVSELWIDAKLPRAQRRSQPILTDADGNIFFVAGLRPGAAAAPPPFLSVSLRVQPAPGATFSPAPIVVEKRAATVRANIPESIDEET